MKYNISVEWTGSYPNLCRGKDTSGDYRLCILIITGVHIGMVIMMV